MFKKVLLLFFFVCAVQISSTKADAADEARKLYYKLLEVVGEAITEGNNTANAALDDLKAYALQIEAAAKDEIAGILDGFQKQLDDINAKAKQLGIDIEHCRNYEVQFSHLPDTVMDEIVKCINDEITLLESKIIDASNQAMKIQQDFYNIEKELDDCGSGWKSIPCYAELAAKITEDITTGPEKIKSDYDAAVQIIKNAWDEVKKCSTNAVEAVPGQATKIVKDFAVCCALPSM